MEGKSKRGGYRPNAGRKSKAQKAAKLVEAGILSDPPEAAKKAEEVLAVLGRPSGYKPEFATQAEKLCRLGATEREIADFFGVATVTIWRWAHAHDDFCSALRAGKEACDDRVERSLYHRAIGYSHEAVKIFMPAGAKEPVYAPYTEHVPPDVGAASLWLRNRRGEVWRDKVEVKHSGAINRAEDLSDAELEDIASGRGDRTAEAPPGADKPDRVH
jgi:hypothetical protein